MAKMIIEDVRRVLSDVSAEKCFWFNNRPIVRNIYELVATINNISEDAFKYHVNEEKNDFSNWIRDVLKDEKLAKTLLKTKTKNTTVKKIKERIKYLEKIIDKCNIKE